MKPLSSASCSMLTGGDVAPDRKSGKNMFGDVASFFEEADFAFVNLENALSLSGRLMKGKPTFHRGTPEMVEGLVEAQFDAVTIANNHILDFGEESLFETIDVLRANSIPFTGAGKNLDEAARPLVMERNGLRIGLLAYSTSLPRGFPAGPKEPGVNPLRVETAYRMRYQVYEQPGKATDILTWAVPEDLQRMQANIYSLRKKTDIILVYQHWGTSMIHEVHDFQKEIAHAAVDAGADAVFGGHQHVLSGIEFYKGKPIVHCTGNLVFDIVEPFFTDATLQTFLFGCTLTKEAVCDCYIIPCRCGVKDSPVPLPIHRAEGREIVKMIGRLSEPFGTRLKTEKDRVLVIPPPNA